MRLWLFLAAYGVSTGFFFRFTIDDAGITLRYAYNLAHAGVLSYNLDGQHVYGTTTLLWALVTTPVMFLDGWIDLLLACKLLSFGFGIAGVVLCHRLASKLTIYPYLFFMTAATLAVPYVVFAYSAMEFTFSIVLLALFLTNYATDYSRRRLGWLAWLGVLIFFTRPEFILITGPLFTAVVIHNRTRVLRDRAVLLGPAALAVAGFAALWLYYGTIVPLPFEAKLVHGLRDPGVANGVRRVGEWGCKQGILVIAAIAAAWAVASQTVRRGIDLPRTAWLAGCGLLFLGYFMSRGGVIVMDDAGRYYHPGFLVLALAAANILDAVVRTLRARPPRLATVAAVLLLPLVSAGGLYYAKYHDWNLATVRGTAKSTDQYADLMNNAYIPMGKYIRDNYPRSSKLLVRDAGLVPFYSRLDNVLDTWSLNEPRIVACRRTCLPEVVSQYDPDLVMQEAKLVAGFKVRYQRVKLFRAHLAKRGLSLSVRK